jgi:hypothetical protein
MTRGIRISVSILKVNRRALSVQLLRSFSFPDLRQSAQEDSNQFKQSEDGGDEYSTLCSEMTSRLGR